MKDLSWGLWMTLAGMGAVFILLIALMGLLYAIGRLDRGKQTTASAEATTAAGTGNTSATGPGDPASETPASVHLPGGLTVDELAAITIAVIRHARVRRMQASPEARLHEPGAHLFASRWVSIGRGYQQQPWNRGN